MDSFPGPGSNSGNRHLGVSGGNPFFFRLPSGILQKSSANPHDSRVIAAANSPTEGDANGEENGRKKGDGHLLCEAPEGQ